MPYRLGIDTGGTFTDLALIDEATGEARLHKLSSTPKDPSEAILQGITEILANDGLDPTGVTYLGHGTTVATNAVIQGKLARTALITTDGFRDVIELARQRRPDLYNIDVPKPRPPVPRNLRREVRERLQHDGSVLYPLDEEEVRKAVRELKAAGVISIAVCFLHSYLNPEHERAVARIVREEYPECAASLSSEVLPEFREFERFSTTMVNAALVPVMSTYLNRLEGRVSETGLGVGPRIMQSSGGVMGGTAAGERPVNTLFSGPSAGVIGATHVAVLADMPDVITFDMGGTSTDVCLVEKGLPLLTNLRTTAGFPVKAPTLDVHSIGAGGGSTGWVDAGSFLRVGPQSAGANPGPACYGLGGPEPAITDANVVLGRLNPTQLLAGRMAIDASLSERAIMERVAKPMGMDLIEAARGMVTIVNSNIIGAIRVISVERGYDPRQFTLMAFGGAGPLHAAQLARDLGMPRVLVPEAPGVLCALGLLVADLRADFGRTFITKCANPDVSGVNRVFEALEEQARGWLQRENAPEGASELVRSADMHYVGQDYELSVPVPPGDLDTRGVARLADQFHTIHEQVHGYASPDAPVEIVALRIVARSAVPRPAFKEQPAGGNDPSRARIGSRRAYFDEARGFTDCPLYDRAALLPGNRLTGPAILEQMDSTTVILPGQEAEVDRYRNVVIHEA